jgi:hypothetical protein
VPAQGLHRHEPDDLRVRPGELGRGEAERLDACLVLGDESGGQLEWRRLGRQRRPRFEQADVEVGFGVAEGEHRAGIRAQVPDLQGARLGQHHDRLAVPHEPRRHEVGRAVDARRRQPDHRLRFEEPLHAGGGEGVRVHAQSIEPTAIERRGRRSRTGMDIRRGRSAPAVNEACRLPAHGAAR